MSELVSQLRTLGDTKREGHLCAWRSRKAIRHSKQLRKSLAGKPLIPPNSPKLNVVSL